MSRRARTRANARPWNQHRPEPDSSGLEQALATLAAERQRREQQQPQQKG